MLKIHELVLYSWWFSFVNWSKSLITMIKLTCQLLTNTDFAGTFLFSLYCIDLIVRIVCCFFTNVFNYLNESCTMLIKQTSMHCTLNTFYNWFCLDVPINSRHSTKCLEMSTFIVLIFRPINRSVWNSFLNFKSYTLIVSVAVNPN